MRSTVATGGPSEFNTTTRERVVVWVNDRGVILGGAQLDRLGFTPDEADTNRTTFVKYLKELSDYLSERAPDDFADTGELERALHLDTDADASQRVDDFLFDLREIGWALRDRLTPEIVGALQNEGFLHPNPMHRTALTFIEYPNSREASQPYIWEMLYEAETPSGDPEWHKFWGFWAPIAHWISISRRPDIKLEHGLFAAIHEGLRFAQQEADYLSHLPPRFDSLAKMLRENLGGDAMPPSADWLREMLTQQQLRGTDKLNWIREQLQGIFMSQSFEYELIHFACHCLSEENAALSKLVMQVGGEDLPMSGGWMASLHRKPTRPVKTDPGLFVFLNACSTTTASAGEPPRFVQNWIEKQGANAVVATLSPVPDYFGYAFARKFYDLLFDAIQNPNDPQKHVYSYLAEALLATRIYFMEKYNNPLGLAYILYAVEGAQLSIPSRPIGSTP
jgi:hypothetical protein